MSGGPLAGLRMVELGGIGPAPFAAMMLTDMGAETIRIDRIPTGTREAEAARTDLLNRGRRSVAMDLKHPDAAAVVLKLVAGADVLIEGFRPGVAERLGVGPEACHEVAPALVYGRATGWGQTGPLSSTAGHDIGYISVAGALYPIGEKGGPPVPPLALVGDFGGGGMLLAFGVVAALWEARTSGQGQVVDAAIVDGAALLTTALHRFVHLGEWTTERGTNLLDGGAPFYRTYETLDRQWISIGPLEPRFYRELLERIGFDDVDGAIARQDERADWPATTERLAKIFRGKTRAEWVELFEGTDGCLAPVLAMQEAPQHPHHIARQNFIEVDGAIQPAPAPRLSRTPAPKPGRPPQVGEHTRPVLHDWGFDDHEIEDLLRRGVVA